MEGLLCAATTENESEKVKTHPHFLTWFLAACVFQLAFAHRVEAGGSISWEEVRARIATDDPFIAAFIAEHLDVARGGSALRVGHDKDGNSLVTGYGVGERIPPYDFVAKPKGAAGEFSMEIHLEELWYEKEKKVRWQLTIKQLPLKSR